MGGIIRSGSYMWILQFLYILPLFQCILACDFDKISLSLEYIPRTVVNYNSIKFKRDIHNSTEIQFSPLRIAVHYGQKESDISENAILRLQTFVNKAIQRVSNFLSVIPVKGPLFLTRKGCGSKWFSGKNAEKCSNIKSGYKGEFCENKIDNFLIPPDHLNGLDVYSQNDSKPVKSYKAGSGVNNADFILYVTALYSSWCHSQDILAYASFCQLDLNDRPVAGLMNFCPEYLRKDTLREAKAVNTVIHELLHTLGFSLQLFSKFKNCNSKSFPHCAHWKKIMKTAESGIRYLMLPSVAREMQKHFKCFDEDYGAPLANSTDGFPSSHWDPLVMYGSIMTPEIGEAESTFLDPITASVFADSGWYRVNYSAVEKYHWGKGGGCNFGVESSCRWLTTKYPYLCNPKDHAGKIVTCDYLHLTKTTCQSVNHHTCGVFKPNMSDSCGTIGINEDKFLIGTTNVYQYGCFMFGKDGELEATCAPYRCISDRSVEIVIDHILAVCPVDKIIDVEIDSKVVTIYCPRSGILCDGLIESVKFHDPHVVDPIPQAEVRIQIIFDTPKPEILRSKGKHAFKQFHEAALFALAEELKVPYTWVNSSSHLMVENRLFLSLLVAPPYDAMVTVAEVKKMIYSLQAFLSKGLFGFNFEDLIVIATTVRIDPTVTEYHADLAGYVLLSVMIGIGILVVTVVSIAFGIVRYKQKLPPAQRYR